jgi:excisionase family DNA binding protein
VSNFISTNPSAFEPFVDAERAATFLAMPRKTLLTLAHQGRLPAHGVAGRGRRKIWKFRISELDSWMRIEVTSECDQGRIQERKNFL